MRIAFTLLQRIATIYLTFGGIKLANKVAAGSGLSCELMPVDSADVFMRLVLDLCSILADAIHDCTALP